MRRGDFAAAWKISDALLSTRNPEDQHELPRHLQSIWNGEPVRGKRVLVRCYHGLGDTIHYIRYVPLLKAQARDVIVWAQPSLIPLLRTVNGVDQLIELHDGAPDVEYDLDLEITELPYVFRTTLDTIPADVPYVHVEPAPLPRDERLKAGIIWQSGDWDASRSIPFDQLQRLTELTEVDWHVLQRDPLSAGWDGKFGTISGGHNPLDDARLMRALDLVITVDTMTAHLAGALGQRTWTLLPVNADWRWLLQRADSPWYPTMRLFRQKTAAKWGEVIAEVESELKRLISY